ncbi:MAG: HD domain-containing protein [Chitinivibrionia bacterium]|nr:HD domain-containing protein [Chitinivibrionia bacterium]
MPKNRFDERVSDIYSAIVKNARENVNYSSTNFMVVAIIALYGVYRCFEINAADGGIKIFFEKTAVIVCAISVSLILLLQFFKLFVNWQPFIIGLVLFLAETARSVIVEDFAIYFNIITAAGIIVAFYFNVKNYFLYFLTCNALVAILYFNHFYSHFLYFPSQNAITYSATSFLLSWFFYAMNTFIAFLLICVVRRSFYLVERRDKISLDLLARAGELRDNDTGNHLLRTTYYSSVIIDDLLKNPHKNYAITKEKGNYIVNTVKLHDIGKIAVTDNVLLKPGSLSKEEFEIIKTHTDYGAKMLDEAINIMDGQDALLSTAYDIAYGHHEKWDGSGYPRGLSGFDIPISARVAAIADVFDALTTERPYKKAFPAREAFDILYKDAGSHFDPYLIEIVKKHEKDFVEILEKFR